MENKITMDQSVEFLLGVRFALDGIAGYLDVKGYPEAASEIRELVAAGERMAILLRQQDGKQDGHTALHVLASLGLLFLAYLRLRCL
jgi:hypothetical protein